MKKFLVGFFLVCLFGVAQSYSVNVVGNDLRSQNTAQSAVFLFTTASGGDSMHYDEGITNTLGGVGCSAGAGWQVVAVWVGLTGSWETATLATIGANAGDHAAGGSGAYAKGSTGMYYVINALGTCTTMPTYNSIITLEQLF